MALVNYNLCFDEESNKFVAVNPETGEIKDLTAPKKTTTRKKTVKEESTTPELVLSDNKYSLNSAAVELMGVQPDDKLVIKMRKVNRVMMPIIGTCEAFKVKDGNRLTKSFTVACRGANHEALAAYGTRFTLEPTDEGTFILKGNIPMNITEDDNLNQDCDLPEGVSVDLSALEDEPEEATEIDGDTFAAMLEGID